MLKPLFTKEEIDCAVKRLADSIEKDFDDEEILFVCLLKGSFMFLSDLIRSIKNPSRVDFMRVSSYGSAMKSKGEITITKDLEEDIEGKNVIIVEDIIDSGLTLKVIKEMLIKSRPKTLKICALLNKKACRLVKMAVSYTILTLPTTYPVWISLVAYSLKQKKL